jgi:NADH-quinone oxidoreductase subunit N
MNYVDLAILTAPEIILTVAALLILVLDVKLFQRRPVRSRMFVAAALAIAACLAASAWICLHDEPGRFFGGMLVIDSLTVIIKPLLLVMTIFTAIVALPGDFTDHVGEFFALILLASIGMLFLVSTDNVLMIFISLELLSLSLYILTAFNKHNFRSAEAALKYFLVGSISAAFMLFGLSLLYGLTNELNLTNIAAKLAGSRPDPLLLAAVVLVVAGFGFKVAAVPFHLWAPDAYEGAPAPSAALIASGSKLASFFVLGKVLMIGFECAEGSGAWQNFAQGWAPVIATLAAASIFVGNLAAIAQSSVRRLLAYSAIAQAGYMLIGLLANNANGLASLIYYAVTYALTTLGAFGVVALVQGPANEERFATFAGLSRRAPLLSFCMMIFLLSLAGIPPLAGFFGKFYLFTAAAGKSLGLLWLVIFAIMMSAVSLYYYLQVLKQIYVVPVPDGAPAFSSPLLPLLAIVVLAAAVVVLGCAPELLVGKLLAAIKNANW